ncbi:MAG: beta-lactamase family protein, partial [Holophagales bacterium]|nr:beta-lactamase family protein [Holophagales bacterium]
MVEPFAIDAPLPVDRPENVGFDSSRLEEMARRIAAEPEHELHGLLIARHGKVVFERYYHGFDRDTPHDLRSATKSLTSLLVGAAIAGGHLDSVDQPMMAALAAAYPQVHDKDDITLRHLLTMSSGLDCNDRDRSSRGQEDRMYRKRDWLAHFLSLERIHHPGNHTAYCTGGVVALGEVIASSSGEDFADFADRALFR